jgi:Tol biopolymer transport system component
MDVLVSDNAPRTPGPGKVSTGPMISVQAWAPDDRRFVYENERGYITIFDLATREHKEIALGRQPAWSPDGTCIVALRPIVWGSTGWGDDIFLISVRPPYAQTDLLQARGEAGSTFYGPAVWLPDSRWLVIHYVGFFDQPSRYVLDRTTGHTAELPRGYRGGESWGGTVKRAN